MRKPARKTAMERRPDRLSQVAAPRPHHGEGVYTAGMELRPSQRVRRAIEMADALWEDAARKGLNGPGGFDMKAFTDEGWGL